MRNYKLVIIFLVLLLGTWACSFSLPGSSLEPDEPALDEVATAVALTLAATDGGIVPGLDPTPPPPPPPAVLRVVFIDDSDLWLWTEGSAAVELYDDATLDVRDVRISEDGLVVVFTLQDSFNFIGLWAINTDGSNIRQLIDLATINAMSTEPAAVGVSPYRWDFVPGTHTIAFNTRLQFEGPGLFIQDDLRLVDADTAILSTLLTPGNAGQFYYSPDGSQIALVKPSSISLINADNSNRRDSVLTYDPIITYSEFQWYALPRWSTDSSALAVVIPSADVLDIASTIELYDIPLDGSPAVFLGFTAAVAPIRNQAPTISPDLSMVAFTRRVGPIDSILDELQFLNPSSGVITLYYTATNLDFESWSPNGTHFIFSEGGSRLMGELGAGFSPVGGLTDVRQVVWIDDTTFLFANGGFGTWQIQIGSLSGPNILIATLSANFVSFDFSN